MDACVIKHGAQSRHMDIPYGALVDHMPTPDRHREAGTFEAKTRTGFFLADFRHPGGKLSGDYIVVDFESLRSDLDLVPSKASIHSTKEVNTTA